jgi:hypothetical protein
MSKTVQQNHYPRGRDGIVHPDRLGRESDRLTPEAAMIVIGLLSLGLWWVVWYAFSSLASAF